MVTPSWSSLAARAEALYDVPVRQVSDPSTPEARQALAELTEAIVAEGVERKVAERAVTRWLILRRVDGTRLPIEECVRIESGDVDE